MKYTHRNFLSALVAIMLPILGLSVTVVCAAPVTTPVTTPGSQLGKLDMALIKSDAKAAYELLKDKKDKASLFRLGKLYLYQSGKLGLQYDDAQAKAKQTLAKAGKLGHKDAMFEYAINFIKGDDAAKAIEKAANQGSALAALYLGRAYYFGKRGHKKDYAKAKHYFQIAAKAGNAKGYYHLGILYDFGHGVGQDSEKAVRFYSKALAAGYYRAYLQLGKLYASNQKVKPRDILDTISVRFYQKNFQAALPKLIKLADSGNVRAQYILGTYYIANRYKADKCGKAQKYLYLALQGKHPGVRDRLKYIHSPYSVCR